LKPNAAMGDAGDLPLGMKADVSAVRLQRFDRQPADENPRVWPAGFTAVAPEALRRRSGVARALPEG
jgi:hypothetical protein